MSFIWEELYQGRLEWANKAYIEFLNEVFPEKAQEFKERKELSLAVFGSTQVGKTTLILKLTGIKDEQLQEVSRILRGDRGLGKSSTATATIYIRSHDDNWHIDECSFSEEQFLGKLAENRKAVESGRHETDRPISIKIPCKYFDEVDTGLTVKILDLPGINSDDEAKYLDKFVEEHIRYVDLIIFVGKSDDLGFLKPERLNIDYLKYWSLGQNSRYRIVLTHAVSPESFKKWLKTQETKPDKQTIRKYIYEQFKSFDDNKKEYENRIPENALGFIYTLEYGNSWDTLDEDSKANFKPIIDELFCDLIEDIRQSATEYGRIKNAFAIHHYIQHEGDEKIRFYKTCIHEKIKFRKKEKKNIRGFQAYTTEQEKIKKEIKQRFFELKKGIAKLKNCNLSFDCRLDKKSADALREYIACIQRKILERYQAYAIEYTVELLDQSQINNKFDSVYSKLNGYWLDSYWSDKNYESDQSLIRSAADEAVRFATIELGRNTKKALDKTQEELKKISDKIERAKCYGKKHEEKLYKINKEICNIKKDCKIKKGELDGRLAQSKKFSDYLQKGFDDETLRVCKKIEESDNPADVFFHICYIRLLYEEFDKLNA